MSAAPPRGPTPIRLLAAAAVAAAAGVFGLSYLAAGLGYGRDIHAARAGAAGAALFAGFAVALWPRVRLPVRGVALLAGLGGAGAAWWWVPAGSGGPSLAAAVADRDDVERQLAEADVPELTALNARAEVLRKHFPDLALGLHGGVLRRADRAAAAVGWEFRNAAPGDLAAYRAAEARAALLTRVYRSPRPELDAAARDWVGRSVEARVADLRDPAVERLTELERSADARHALAAAFPDTRARLAAAEDEHVLRRVEFYVSLPWAGRDADLKEATPKERREWCGRHRDLILELRSLDATPERFRAARGVLFRAAHEAAREECRTHLAAGRYAAAFGVARAHAVEWFATAEILGPEEQRDLAGLRDGYRYLAALDQKAGAAPDPAPPPRTRP
ncbi:MAG: hypothetical protein C0501_10815 [Isosphaera sp.]|nr:hypothetical protein [Isosphaera sp.]